MHHPRLFSVNSPLRPIPPMTKTFDFSPNVISGLQSSKGMSLASSTPDIFNISSPNVSPIKIANPSMQHQSTSSNSYVDVDLDSFTKKMELLSFDADEGKDDSFNKSNINNHQLNVDTILDDMGLKQYKSLFHMHEIDLIAFFLLTDDDLQELGVMNEKHREIFKDAIKAFCGV